MDRYFIITLFPLVTIVSGLSDTDRHCIKKYPGTLNNNFLIGTWYIVYKFSIWLNLIASKECLEISITRPSDVEVERYRTAHGLDAGYSFDDNPMLFNRSGGIYEGMILRDTEIKFFVFDPNSVFFPVTKYQSGVYKRINNDFVLFYTCAVMKTKWLLSRRRDLTEAELQQVITTIDEVKTDETQRLCS